MTDLGLDVWRAAVQIALITLLLQPEADLPDVIVLDEPELGLHPAGLELIAGLVRAAAETTQIILATQSATFLDHFEPDEVIVTESVDGETRFRRPARTRCSRRSGCNWGCLTRVSLPIVGLVR